MTHLAMGCARDSMIHNHKRLPPSYHWEGFGRKNTKPPWFNVRVFDKDRRDVGWVIKDTTPASSGSVGRKGAPPFVFDDDPRIYRPTVPRERGGRVEVPATASSRVMLSRDGGRQDDVAREIGIEAKTAAFKEASGHSRLQMLANLELSRYSELRETICGRGESIKKPLLYPNTVTHQQALNLEKKAGPRPPVDEQALRRQPDTSCTTAASIPSEPWNQHMYLPYSRTRSDFPGAW